MNFSYRNDQRTVCRISVRYLSAVLFFSMLIVNSVAQLTENFDDANFSANPVWTGSTENFIVNGSGELQLNDLDPIATQSFLTTDLNLTDLNNIEWRFRVNQTFPGSDNNHSRIYLASSGNTFSYTTNNTAGVQGYYLKLGEAGSTDVIKLYYDNGNTTQFLGGGISDISGTFNYTIRVVRDNTGIWTVYADPTGGENFVQELVASENTYNQSSYFGIVCTYTSSNADNFFFDNIYAGPVITDTEAPSLLSVAVTSSTTIDLLFSESLDPASAELESNYSIDGSLNPLNAALDNSNPALVHLTFSSGFNSGFNYTITATGISDLSDNISSTLSGNFTFFETGEAQYRSVTFNEILADPTPVVGLPDAEFIELRNNSSVEYYNLDGWKFVNSTTEKILPNHILAPGGFVILCDNTNSNLFAAYGDVIGISSFSALTNSGDSLTLISSSLNLIDVVVYSDAWFASDIKREGGWSLELINPALPCQSSANWAESEDDLGGTPGAENSVFGNTPDTTAPVIASYSLMDISHIQIQFSETMDTTGYTLPQWSAIPFNSILSANWNGSLDAVILELQFALNPPAALSLTISGIRDCSGNTIVSQTLDFISGFLPEPGDVIINEIMAAPDNDITSLPDVEYIELRNNSNKTLDITGLKINSGVFESQVILQPDSFIVITDDSDFDLFTVECAKAAMSGFPGLTNSGLALSITDADGNVFDALTYSVNWYKNEEKSAGGWSLERINPLATCSGAYNWRASNDPLGGSPGYENSVFNTTDNGSPEVLAYGVLNSNQIYIRFSESMLQSSTANIVSDLLPDNAVSNPVWNSDGEVLIFETAIELEPGVNYSLNITGLTDCDGLNAIPSALNFLMGFTPEPGDIIINEILADVNDGEQFAVPGADFIEIYNRTDHVIELTRVRINSGFFESQVILQPDSFIVVADDDTDLAIFLEIPNKAYMNGFPALTEAGTTITLKIDNTILEEISYNKSWYNDPNKDDGGWSLERINPLDPCNSRDNWHACVNSSGTTAGRRNSVLDFSADVKAPQLLFVFGEPENAITLLFNEPIDENTLDALVWTVNGTVITDFNPEVNGAENDSLVLHYSSMTPGALYTFSLEGIKDCWGNTAGIIHGRFGLAQTASPGDLIINEILYDQKDGGSDFVEVYNRSEKIISLNGWKIADATSGEMNTADLISARSLLLFPGEYLILTKNGITLDDFYPQTITSRILDVEGLADFSSEDMVFLLLPDGQISDQLSYDPDMQYALLNSTDGVSLERISFNRQSSDKTNWHSAAETAGFATPGFINSQSELLTGTSGTLNIEPPVFSPDNDGYQDFVTFSYELEGPGYTGNIRIYNSEGYFIRHLMKNELLGMTGSITWDGFDDNRQKASIGIYVVHFEAFNTAGDVVKTKKTCVLAHPLN